MTKLSHWDHAVMRLRFLRASGESRAEQERVAKIYQRNIGIDPDKLLLEASKPGPVEKHQGQVV